MEPWTLAGLHIGIFSVVFLIAYIKGYGIVLREHHKKEIRHESVIVIFSITLGLCCILFNLYMLEIINGSNSSFHLHLWRIVTSLLIILLVVLLPIIQIYFLLSSYFAFSRYTNIILTSIVFSIYLYFFYKLEDFLPFESLRSFYSESSNPYLGRCLKHIGYVGVTFMAILSGFISVKTPYELYFLGKRSLEQINALILKVKLNIDTNQELIKFKYEQINSIEKKYEFNIHKGFFSKWINCIQKTYFERELLRLDNLHEHLYRELEKLEHEAANIYDKSTLFGKFQQFGIHIFSIYCIYKIVTNLIGLLPNTRSASVDPIHYILALITTHWNPNLDQEVWAQQIAFLGSGIIIITSIRSILDLMCKISLFTPSLLTREQTLLFLASLSGFYLLSVTMLLLPILPSKYRDSLHFSLGLSFNPILLEYWFSLFFIFTCIITILFIFLNKFNLSSHFNIFNNNIALDKRYV